MKKKGFTLVEIMAVVAILGILVLLVAPRVINYYRDSKKLAFINEAKTVYSKATDYFVTEKTKGHKVNYITNIKDKEENVLALQNEKNLEYEVKLSTKGKVVAFKLTNNEFCIVGSDNFLDDYTKEDVIELEKDDDNLCFLPSVDVAIADTDYSINYSLSGGTLGEFQPRRAGSGEEIIISNPTKQSRLHFVQDDDDEEIIVTFDFKGWKSTDVNTSKAKYGEEGSVTNNWDSTDKLIEPKYTYFKDLGNTETQKVTMEANWNAKIVRVPSFKEAPHTYIEGDGACVWASGNIEVAPGDTITITEEMDDEITFKPECKSEPDNPPIILPSTLVCGVEFKYTGSFTYKDGIGAEKHKNNSTVKINNCNWYIRFTSNGTFTLLNKEQDTNFDIQSVGGGGGGVNNCSKGELINPGGGGGGGGYTKTVTNYDIQPGSSFDVVIGMGGNAGKAGQESYFVQNGKNKSQAITLASGGNPAKGSTGGNGGTGGSGGSLGAGGLFPCNVMNGYHDCSKGETKGDNGHSGCENSGQGGSPGKPGYGQKSKTGPNGESGTTGDFGDNAAPYFGDGGAGGSQFTSFYAPNEESGEWNCQYDGGVGCRSPYGGGGTDDLTKTIYKNGIANTGGGGAGSCFSSAGKGGSGVVSLRTNKATKIKSSNDYHQWVYGKKSTTLICQYYGSNASNLYYLFSYSSGPNTEPTTWNAKDLKTDNTLIIGPKAYSGDRYYFCRVYKKVGSQYELVSYSIDGYKVEIDNVKLTFNRVKSGVTINGETKFVAYSRMGSDKLYEKETSERVINYPSISYKGYELEGWYNKSSGGSKVINGDNTLSRSIVSGYTVLVNNKPVWDATSAKNLYGRYVLKDYKITYNLDGGRFTSSALTSYNINTASYTLLTPVKEGYTFLGWTGTDINGMLTKVIIKKGSINDRTYTAHWSEDKYNIALKKEANHKLEIIEDVGFDRTVTFDPLNITGKTFVGWTSPRGLATTTAQHGREVNSNIVWDNWVKGTVSVRDNKFRRLGAVNSSVDILGNYVDSSEVEYLISYNLDGANSITSAPSYGKNDTAINISNPSKTGYDFAGWTSTTLNTETAKSGTAKTKVTNAWSGTANKHEFYKNLNTGGQEVILNATFNPHKYNIVFNTTVKSGTSAIALDPSISGGKITNVVYDQTVTIRKPIRVGYTFLGWTASDNFNSTTARYGNTEEANTRWYDKTTKVTDVYFKNLSPKNNVNVKLIPNWKTNGYNISYDFLAGEDTNDPDVKENNFKVSITGLVEYSLYDKELTVNTPTRDGYTFLGWTIKNINKDTALYYNSSKKWVKFTSDEPSNITLKKFKNLNPDDEANVIFEAHWKKNKYSITYELNSGKFGETHADTADYDTLVTISNPTRDQFVFLGWTAPSGLVTSTAIHKNSAESDGELWNNKNTKVMHKYFRNLTTVNNGTVKLSANWMGVKYVINYELNGGAFKNTIDNTYEVGKTKTLPVAADVERVGYTFAGWYKDESLSGSAITSISSNTHGHQTVYAKWTPINYKVTFNYNGGTATTSGMTGTKTFAYGQVINVENPTKKNNIFIGWQASNISVDNASYGSAADSVDTIWDSVETYSTANYFKNLSVIKDRTVTLRAMWVASGNQYAIKYKSGTATVTKVYKTSDTVDKNKLLRTGYTLTSITAKNGVSSNAKTGTSTSNMSSWNGSTTTNRYFKNIGDANSVKELDVVWTPNTYTIAYSLAGGTSGEFAPTSATYDEVVEISYPVKAGYTFAGWTAAGTTVATAKYGKTEDKVTTLWSNRATKVTDTYFKNLITTTGKVTLTANWSKITYDIIYMHNYDNIDTRDTYNIEGGKTLLKPTRTGYTFAGWYTNEDLSGNAVTSITKGSYGNKVFYAKWTPVTYKFSYTKNDGVSDTDLPASAEYDKDVEIPNLKKTGSTFEGWTANSNLNTATAMHGSVAPAAIPWTNANTAVTDTIFRNLSGGKAITLAAKFRVHSYSITYDLDGGSIATNGNQPSSVPFDKAFNVTNPTRNGYTFVGWTASGDFNKEAKYGNDKLKNTWSDPDTIVNNGTSNVYFKGLSAADDGEITLIANWEPKNYTLTFSPTYDNNISSSLVTNRGTTSITITYDVEYPNIVPPTINSETVTFLGYFTGKNAAGDRCYDSTGTATNNCDISKNSTLYAMYDK